MPHDSRQLVAAVRRSEGSVPVVIARIAAAMLVAAVIQRVYELTIVGEFGVAAAVRLLLSLTAAAFLPSLWRGSAIAAIASLVALGLSCSSATLIRWDGEWISFGPNTEFHATGFVAAVLLWLVIAGTIGVLRLKSSTEKSATS